MIEHLATGAGLAFFLFGLFVFFKKSLTWSRLQVLK